VEWWMSNRQICNRCNINTCDMTDENKKAIIIFNNDGF
jgi:hypothetical protein